jgi:transcriptional regulator with XRE-family HTH domain
MARPTKYNAEEHPDLARKLTGMGKTQADMAEAFGVARSTIEEWINAHPAFSVAIKLGKEDASDRVERALLERAVGYSHPSEKIVVVSDGQGNGSHVERVDTTEHYPPDTAAAMAWLKNRRAKEWKDKQEVEITGLDKLAEKLAAGRKRITRR